MSITLAMPSPPTTSATAPSPRSSAVNALVGGGLCLERVGGPADLDLLGVLGVGGRGEDRPDVVDERRVRADVDGRRRRRSRSRYVAAAARRR